MVARLGNKLHSYFKRLRDENFSPRFMISRVLLWGGYDLPIKLTFNSKHHIRTYLHASSAAHKLFAGKYHADTDIAVFEKYIKQGDMVFDLGANIGMFTTLSARLVGGKGRVYAFEPTADTFVHLLENLALNKVHNALPVYGAVSDSESEVRIVDHPRSKEQNYIDKQATQGTLVPAYQLDSFCHQAGIQAIDFLKIDVEGAELPALKSLGKKITNVKCMYIEVSEENFATFDYAISDLVAFLRINNFELFMPKYQDNSLELISYKEGDTLHGRNIIACNTKLYG